jgi:hypothetical protein
MTTENLAVVARAILERRKRLSTIIQSGALQAELGVDGFTEALQRRWVVPDYSESGALQVTDAAALIQELEATAGQLKVGDPVTVADNGKTIVGVVKEVRPDGRVVVSFGDQKPASGKNDFAPTEVAAQQQDRTKSPAGYSPTNPLSSPPPVGTAHP